MSRQAILVHKSQPTISYNGWTSNIGLIRLSKRTDNIRTVDIEIDSGTDIISVLKSIETLLSETHPWTNAKSLRLVLGCNTTETAGLAFNNGANSESEDVNACNLLRHMPNISTLCITGNELCSGFVQKFSTLCANQLISYTGRASALDVLQIPLRLTSLTLTFDNHSSRSLFPRIDASVLRLLKLTDLPDDSMWICFSSYIDQQDIWFYNLESLSLSYIAGYTEHTGYVINVEGIREPYCLHFPRLQKLEIENCPSGGLLIDAAINTAILKDISITDISGKVEPSKLVNNASLEALSITSYSPLAKDEFFRNTANRLFGNGSKAKHISLTLGYSSGIPNPGEISWSRLHKLTIFAPVSSETLLRLIPKMPNLMELVLGGSVTHDWSAPFENGFAAQTEADIVQPISTSLIAFYLGDVFLSHVSDTTEFLKYVLLKTPSLVEFACSEEHFTGLLEFLKAKYITYPHLRAINYNVLA
ncbi:hypothetical protein H4R24_001899 [Coemansia sp. RSA 988]|nr:hypothetical protein H4R24_001899 [Coemansia sp. RSA 988]